MARRPNLTPELRAEKLLEYIQCHAVQHRWDPIPVTHPPSFGAAVDLRCENCGTVRRDIFSRVSGQRIGRPYYDYPEDYHDYERHDKAWWRGAWLEKLAEVKAELVNIENESRKGAVMSRTGNPLKWAPEVHVEAHAARQVQVGVRAAPTRWQTTTNRTRRQK